MILTKEKLDIYKENARKGNYFIEGIDMVNLLETINAKDAEIDVLLKKFEGLAGNLRKSGAQSGLMIRRRALFDCADELHSLIEQIRKERE